MQTQKNATTTTTTKAAALAEMIAQRQAAREAARADAEQQQREREEQDQQGVLDHLARWAMNHISADLRQALDIDIHYDEEAAKNDDDGPSPAYFTFHACGTSWKIQHEFYQYRYEYWLTSADGYRKIVTPEYSNYDITPEILDALGEYPAWLAKAEEREAAEAERTRQREEQNQQKEAARAARRCERIHTWDERGFGTYHRGVFGVDQRQQIVLHNPSDTAHVTVITGRVTDQSARWLLIVPDDEKESSHLIPQSRIVYIRPL